MNTIEKSQVVANSCGTCSTPSVKATPNQGTASAPAPVELHICAGLNACRGHDRYGTNSCAGTGYCATASAHSCHTLNNCRGQGGCGLYGDSEEQSKPGANDCSWQGSCAVPIQAERYSTQGENTGKSVWVLARKLFEDRMTKGGRTFGDSPFKCGPPQAWLTEILGSYDSCGSSGNKYCTFGFNDPAKDAAELCKRSEPAMCGEVKAYSEAHGCSNDPEGGPAACSAAPEDPDEGGGSGPAGCSAKPGGGGGFHASDVEAYMESNGCDTPGGPAGCSAAPEDPDDPEGGPAGCSAAPEDPDGDNKFGSGPAGCSAKDEPEDPKKDG